MEHLEWIVSLASACLGLTVTVATLVVKFAKSAKVKRAAQQALALCNAVIPYIKEAEAFVGFGGAEKKEYVMTKARQFALNAGIKIDEEQVSAAVDELVKMTKEVNVGKTESKKIRIPAER